jgi:hypothetical protein
MTHELDATPGGLQQTDCGRSGLPPRRSASAETCRRLCLKAAVCRAPGHDLRRRATRLYKEASAAADKAPNMCVFGSRSDAPQPQANACSTLALLTLLMGVQEPLDDKNALSHPCYPARSKERVWNP